MLDKDGDNMSDEVCEDFSNISAVKIAIDRFIFVFNRMMCRDH